MTCCAFGVRCFRLPCCRWSGCFATPDGCTCFPNLLPAGSYHLSITRFLSGDFQNHVAKFYAAQVAQALGSLHKQDIVYRNIHPDNIMLSPQGHIKLVGFGFAKVLRDTDSTRTICGCHDYLAPEVLTSEGTTMASDWWSWGVLIYFMLAGTNPFHQEALDKHGNVIGPLLYQNILRCEVDFPHWLGDQATSLIRSLLARDPASRLGGKTGRDALALILAHPWFSDVSWETLRDTKAPFIPPADDTDKNGGSLNKYDESDNEESEDDERYRDLFPDF